MGQRRAAWLVLGLVLGACAAPRRDWQRGEWIVVTDLARPELRADEHGQAVGAEADLLRSVAESTDRVLVLTRVDSTYALELLESGRADVGIFAPEVVEAWGGRVDPLSAPFDELGWRVTPARTGVLEELVAALEDLRPPLRARP